MAYRHRGDPNLYPADAVLNLPSDKYSHGLARLTAIEAPRRSFGQAAEAITRATGVRIGKRQFEQLTVAAAADVDAFYAAHQPAPAASDVLLVMQYDGKGIVMRPGALREATAKAAAGARRKLATRLSPGEKNGRKRMAELGCVHDCEPVPRTAADIITRPGKSPPKPARAKTAPVAAGKWLTASVTDDIPAVIAAGFTEADRRDPARARTWIALAGGNKQQIEAIETEAASRGAQVTILIDFIHVIEYLRGAAWSFFETGDPAAEEWVADQATKILESKSAQVAAGIRRRATTYGYSARERDGADKCGAYLTAKKPYLDYATVIAASTVEEAMRALHAETVCLSGSPNVCLAGGVAFNCVSNGRLPEPVYIPPFPHDAGVSLGAAWAITPPARPVPLESPYLGGALEAGPQADRARANGLHVESFSPEIAIELLLKGAIGAVAEGRAEAGPRALGHRSIIAVPRPADVRDRINLLKGRERWRPLAPVTLADYAQRLWPGQGRRALYMVGTATVSAHGQLVMPAVTHVDATTRPQVLPSGAAPAVESILRQLQEAGLPPVVVNTSLNGRGEPIIDSAAQAVDTLKGLGLDFLVLDQYLIRPPR
jgi:hypothetical protein